MPEKRKHIPPWHKKPLPSLTDLTNHPLVKLEIKKANLTQKDGLIRAMVMNVRTLADAKLIFAALGEEAWQIENNLVGSDNRPPANYVNDFVRQFMDLYIKEYQKQHNQAPNQGIKKA